MMAGDIHPEDNLSLMHKGCNLTLTWLTDES